MRRSLGVNVDHIATLRQARGGLFPDPVEAALRCVDAGAESIIAHLREDRRHIQDADILKLKRQLKVKFNIEASISPTVLKTILKAHPNVVTFVPEKRQEKTTEAGLDVMGLNRRLEHVLDRLRREGIGISLFIDPDIEQVKAAIQMGVHDIEIHTGEYANARSKAQRQRSFAKIVIAAQNAHLWGLRVHVGHGLDYENVTHLAKLSVFEEFNIGYSIVTRAVFVGLKKAVHEMKRLIRV
jgi:pyridoxine 5-phosphate synthase